MAKFKKGWICLFLIAFSFLSFVNVCDATVNKATATVSVHTTSENNWYEWAQSTYVNAGNPLHTFVTCDAVSYTANNTATTDRYNKNGYCNKNANLNDNYLYTDSKDETRLYPVSENFTITASASASSGSMTGVLFEWISVNSGVPATAHWNDPAHAPGSFTCPATGTCTICVQGGTCANDVIPQSVLGVNSDGSQRRFYYRMTFSSSSGDSVTTGYDPAKVLDKYYWIVICGPKCPAHVCNDHAPTVAVQAPSTPSNFCNGLNDVNSFYTLNWAYGHMPSNTTQTYYKVSVKNLTTGVVNTATGVGGTTFKVPTAWLAYGTTFQWQVQVKFSGQTCLWDITSPWSAAGTNIVTPVHAYPVPSFTVKNQSNADCTVAGNCHVTTDTVALNASASTKSTASATYNWNVEGVGYSGVAISRAFTGNNPTALLTVTDTDGHACSASKTMTFGAPQCIKTAPTLSSSGASGPSASLCYIGDPSPYYKLNWAYAGMPVGSNQSQFVVTVKNAATGVTVGTQTVAGTATNFTIPAGWITYGVNYQWTVTSTVGDAAYCSWAMPAVGGNFSVTAYPNPTFTVKNASNANCLIAGTCHAWENLNFVATANGGTSYAWTVTGEPNPTGATFSRNYPDMNTRAVNVTATNAVGTCTATAQNMTLGAAICSALSKNSISVAQPGNLCTGGLDNIDGFYTLSWATNNPGGYTYTGYTVTVRDKNNVADTRSAVGGASTFFQVPTAWIANGKTYEWSVTVNFTNGAGCNPSFAFPFDSTNFVVPSAYPIPNISISSPSAADCSSAVGACHMSENVTFSGSGSTNVTGGSTYTWNITPDGLTPSGVNYVKNFASKPARTANLTVTDSGHSCSTSKNFTLGDPLCAGNMSTSLTSATHGDFCSMGLGSYQLNWTVNNAASNGATQYRYTVTIRDTSTGIPVSVTNNLSSNSYLVPAGALQYGKTYDWKVDTYLNNGGSCDWTPAGYPLLSSPWSNTYGPSMSFNTPVHAYPTPVASVFNPSSADCLAGNCKVADFVTFDASGSSSIGATTYNWVLDTTSHAVPSFSQTLTTQGHTVILTVKETATGFSCDTGPLPLTLVKSKVKWSEIAP